MGVGAPVQIFRWLDSEVFCTAHSLEGLVVECVADYGYLLFLGDGKYVALVIFEVHLPFSFPLVEVV